jgi:hypothetical protein
MKKIGYISILILITAYFWSSSDEKGEIEEFTSDIKKQEKVTKKKKLKSRSIARVSNNDTLEEKSTIEETSIAINKLRIEQAVSAKQIANFSNKNRMPSSIESYFEDSSIQIEGRNFRVSQRLRSLAIDAYDSSYGIEVSRKSGYILYESDDKSIGQPTLYHNGNKSTAILTGRVLLKNMSKDQAQAIANQMQVYLDSSMGHLGVYAIQAPSDVLETIDKLGDSSSSAEIIEGRIREK